MRSQVDPAHPLGLGGGPLGLGGPLGGGPLGGGGGDLLGAHLLGGGALLLLLQDWQSVAASPSEAPTPAVAFIS